MDKENTKLSQTEMNSAVEDLTVNETLAEEVKGGPASSDYLLEIDGIKGESSDRRYR
jgi:hypothetical protein